MKVEELECDLLDELVGDILGVELCAELELQRVLLLYVLLHHLSSKTTCQQGQLDKEWIHLSKEFGTTLAFLSNVTISFREFLIRLKTVYYIEPLNRKIFTYFAHTETRACVMIHYQLRARKPILIYKL